MIRGYNALSLVADCSLTTQLRFRVRPEEMKEGAAHLRKWDTPPPTFVVVAYTFVNKCLQTLLAEPKDLRSCR